MAKQYDFRETEERRARLGLAIVNAVSKEERHVERGRAKRVCQRIERSYLQRAIEFPINSIERALYFAFADVAELCAHEMQRSVIRACDCGLGWKKSPRNPNGHAVDCLRYLKPKNRKP